MNVGFFHIYIYFPLPFIFFGVQIVEYGQRCKGKKLTFQVSSLVQDSYIALYLILIFLILKKRAPHIVSQILGPLLSKAHQKACGICHVAGLNNV